MFGGKSNYELREADSKVAGWVGVINHLLYRYPAIANPPYINADPLRNTKKPSQKSNFFFNSPTYRHF